MTATSRVIERARRRALRQLDEESSAILGKHKTTSPPKRRRRNAENQALDRHLHLHLG